MTHPPLPPERLTQARAIIARAAARLDARLDRERATETAEEQQAKRAA